MNAVRKRQSTTVHSVLKSGKQEKEITPSTTTIKNTNASSPQAFVTVEGGVTKNLGDYNSAKISISITMPCDPTLEATREMYGKLSDLVDELMEEEYAKVIGDK
jgi:hypothetical protein